MKSAPPPDAAAGPGALPAVVIVGRPNVGKSALFNRLLGRRLAIVHAESGVTRDRLDARAVLRGRAVRVIDTGGLATPPDAVPGHPIAAGILQQAEAAMAQAAAFLFVVDAETGLHPLDADVATRLRRCAAPVFVVANKCDEPARDANAWVFSRFAYPVFPVSALHNRGLDALAEAVVAALPDATAGATAEAPPPLRVAVVGRVNAGKSSLVNRLLGEARLIVSDTPGTTRDAIEIPFTLGHGAGAVACVLVDTAGMRRWGKIDTAVDRYSLMRAEAAVGRADLVLHIVDAVRGPADQDKTIAELIRARARASLVVVNKWDAMAPHATQRAYTEALHRALPFYRDLPLHYVSAATGYNVRRLAEAVRDMGARLDTRLPTPAINRAIAGAVARQAHPMIQGRRFKIYYGTQTGTRPLRLTLFVNDPARLQASWREFLLRQLRTAFGLHGLPLVLDLRAHRERDDNTGGRPYAKESARESRLRARRR